MPRPAFCGLLVSLLAFVVAPVLAHEGHGDAAKKASPADVLRSAKSGPWSAAATWEGGKVPAAGAKVLIRPGHEVAYDVESDAVIRAIGIGGTLRFATDKNTLLCVGLIKIQPGDLYSEEGFNCDAHVVADEHGSMARAALEIGRIDQPLPADKRAIIRLTYVEGLDKQSCPAIVCCGGRMDLHGAPLASTWTKLGGEAKAGDKSVSLVDAPTGWRVGDQIIVTATQIHGAAKTRSVTEERTITAIDGNNISFEEPLKNGHAGTGEFRGEVANLSRNVIVESADPKGVRGHTMYHRGSAGSLTYAEFRHLGKKDVLGRYSLHFHQVGDTMRGSSVVGCSIWDSDNRWLTIHGTNYLIARDNVGYKSIGHGFFFEDGTEVYNVLDRNLAVGASQGKRLPKQVLPFDDNNGAGYWWANSLNTFTRNVAANCDRYGFRYEASGSKYFGVTFDIQQPDGSKKATDIRTLPFVRFDNNEVHSSDDLYGINIGEGVNRVGPDSKHPFIMRNTKIWDIHYAFRPQAPSLLVENMVLHQFVYGVYHPNYDDHVYRNLTLSDSSAAEPFNRGHDDDDVQHGVLAVDGITFDNVRSGGMPLIQISDDNSTGKAISHFRNVKTVNWNDGSRDRSLVNMGGGPRAATKTPHGVPVIVHDYFGPGEDAEVVSTRSPEYKAEPAKYAAVKDLTGNESRAARVKAEPFPEPLTPVDDLPPTSVITQVTRKGDKLLVRGSSADNGEIVSVTVNGQPAKSLQPNYAEWEIELSGDTAKLLAVAADAAKNTEPRGHEVAVVR